jgi:hypothetical protein
MLPSDLQHHALSACRGTLASLGLALALLGPSVAGPQESQKNSPNPVALVNQQPIAVKEADILSQQLLKLRFDQLNSEQQQSVMQILIDQELLLQRAEKLDLLSTDPGLRKAAVASAIDEVVTDFLAQPPTETLLQQFYLNQSSVFETPERVAVDALLVKSPAGIKDAKTLLASGSNTTQIAERLDLDYLLPRSLLPIHMLHRQLGTSLASALLEFKQVGQTQAINLDQGLYIFQISQRQAPVLPRYEAIRNSVLLEYKRRGRDQALNSKLDQLWHSAQIIVAEVQ